MRRTFSGRNQSRCRCSDSAPPVTLSCFSGPPEFYNGSEQTEWQRTVRWKKIGSFPLFNLPVELEPVQDSQCARGAPDILSVPLWFGLNPSFHQLLWRTLRISESVGCGFPDHGYLPQARQPLFLAPLRRIWEWPHKLRQVCKTFLKTLLQFVLFYLGLYFWPCRSLFWDNRIVSAGWNQIQATWLRTVSSVHGTFNFQGLS